MILIDSAAELIRRKVKATVCRMHEYPASDDVITDINKKTAANSLALSFLKLYLLMPSKNVKSQNL